MSTLTAIYLQRRYLECPSITPFTSTAIALHGATDSRATRYNLNHEPNRSPHHFAIDTKHVHQEYDDNHHRREETTSLFHSDYRENYLPYYPIIPACDYANEPVSCGVDTQYTAGVEIPTPISMLPVVPSMTATPAGANYFHVPFQGMLPATTSLTSQTSNSVPVSSWTTTTWENPHDDWVSTPGSNYKLRLDATPWNSHTAFESFSTVPRAVRHPHRQPLAPVATSSFEHNSYDPLNPLSAIQSFTRPSDAGHVSHHSSLPDTENTNPFAPPTLPRRHSLTPPLPYQGPQPSSSVQTLSDGRPYFGIYHPAQKAAPPPRRKRPARAIEYDGFWIDEEELLKGLTAPDGKISVHECHWGEHHSPCHLWIRGDKSCIGSHIQKWHGGKPGGDKLEADCLWSTCRKTMLKESVSRHVVSIHLGEKWKCQGCREEFTRKDAYGRHVEKASKEECRNAGALIMYDADSRVVDARTALASGGRQRYADA